MFITALQMSPCCFAASSTACVRLSGSSCDGEGRVSAEQEGEADDRQGSSENDHGDQPDDIARARKKRLRNSKGNQDSKKFQKLAARQPKKPLSLHAELTLSEGSSSGHHDSSAAAPAAFTRSRGHPVGNPGGLVLFLAAGSSS